MTNTEIEVTLAKVVDFLALLADETAELVDQFHGPRTSPEGKRQHLERVNALTEGAAKLRLALPSAPSTKATD